MTLPLNRVAVVKMPECHDILATTLEPLLQEIRPHGITNY